MQIKQIKFPAEFLIVIIVFLLTIKITAAGLQDKPDSLYKILNSAKPDEKIDIYLELINYYSRVDAEKAIELSNEALNFNFKNKSEKDRADILYSLGLSYHSQSKYQLALEYAVQAHDIYLKINFPVGIGKCLTRMGLLYNHLGEYDKALDCTLRSITILENEGDKIALAAAYNARGILYYILNDIQKAEEYSLEALSFSNSVNDDLTTALSHEHLGIIYITTKEFEKALFHVQNCLMLRKKHNDLLGQAGAFGNLAIIHRNTKEYNKVIDSYNKALEIQRLIKHRGGEAASLSGLGKTFYLMGNYSNSLFYTKQAYEIRKDLDYKRSMVSSLNLMADTYSAMKDYKSALESFKMAKDLSDSLLNEQKNTAIAKIEEEFQAERRNKEILLLQKENTIQKYLRNSLLIIISLLLVFVVFIVFAYKSKRNLNAALKDRNYQITKQAEELKDINEKLKEAVATKDKFFSIIAHDLKSPFLGLMGLIQIVYEDIKELGNKQVGENVALLKSSVDGIYKLLENLLEWANLQRNRITYEPGPVNIYELAVNSVKYHETYAKNKGIKFINNIPGEINLYSDANMLNTIIRNLISNAVKFNKNNGTIELNCIDKGEYSEISIKDSGIGIPPETIPLLFKVGQNISRKGSGGEKSTGLGLVLCKEYIEIQNGKIWVESEVGKGSTFYFTLMNAKAVNN